MKVIECSGSPRQIGRIAGEEMKEHIRARLSQLSVIEESVWQRRFPRLVQGLQNDLPDVFAEIKGIAEGAGQSEEALIRLNLEAQFPAELDYPEGCTNIVFKDGPDGPILGKNDDGFNSPSEWEKYVKVVKPEKGIPQVSVTFCGLVQAMDALNAEGVSIGHSSVGSVFQQSDHNPTIRLWAYEAMKKSKTAEDFVKIMTSKPLRGKGYSIVCVDRMGGAYSLEAACPLVQVREAPDLNWLHCVNFYQLPFLRESDKRSPEGKRDAIGRQTYLDETLSNLETYDLQAMQSVLKYHGNPGICRHGESEGEAMYTKFSFIALPQQNRYLYLHGQPCQSDYSEIIL